MPCPRATGAAAAGGRGAAEVQSQHPALVGVRFEMPAWQSPPKRPPPGRGSEGSPRLHGDSMVGAYGSGGGGSNHPRGKSVGPSGVIWENPQTGVSRGNPSDATGELIWGRAEERMSAEP